VLAEAVHEPYTTPQTIYLELSGWQHGMHQYKQTACTQTMPHSFHLAAQ